MGFEAQTAKISFKLANKMLRNLRRCFSLGVGLIDNFIIHIRIVIDVGDFQPLSLQPIADQIVENRSAKVSNMQKSVDRRSTAIHLHFTLFQGNEFFLLPRQSIINN